MSARIPPGFCEVWMSFSISGDPEQMFCSLGVNLGDGFGADQAVADALLGQLQNSMNDMMSSAYTLGPGHVVFGNDGGDIRIDGTIATATGALAGVPLPNNTSYLIRKITTTGGRRGRGRMYLPGVPEGDVDQAGIITGALATKTTDAQQIRTDMEALPEVEWLALFHDTAPFAPFQITSLSLSNKVATQRRRMRR